MKGWGVVGLKTTIFFVAMAIAAGSFANSQKPIEAGNVSEARVVAEASNGSNWLVNGGNFSSQHFSPLAGVTDKNVGNLGLAWYLDVDSPMGMASEPIVVDGTIYVSASLDRVLAVNAVSGKVLWTYDPHVRLSVMRNSWAARTNRGVAVWEGKVFVGTGDCRLIGLDASTGKQLWDSQVCVDTTQTGITGAPRVGNGKVFIGYNGSDTGVRGSLVAFDANTGKLAWRFWNVPGDPSKGFENKALAMAAKTWSGDKWWTVGGGDVWEPITYDQATGLLIYGTAGASPDYGDRANANVSGGRLFAGCIVAIRADTGEYVWHYQTSIDTENVQVLVADLAIGGKKRHVVMTVPKNGRFYVIDASNGTLIAQKALDGQPRSQASNGRERTISGHNWWPMSYDSLTGLVYIPAFDNVDDPAADVDQAAGRLIAWDPISLSARWSLPQPLPTNSGVLSTAGNLVFQGQGTGVFQALAADTGRMLWSVQTGSAVDAVPVSYAIGNEQYILIPVGLGSGSRLFGPVSAMATPESKRGPSRLLAFRLGVTTPFPHPTVVVPPVPKPPVQTASTEIVHRGEEAFGKFICDDCHSPQADGSGAWVVHGAIPDLRYMPAQVHAEFLGIVLGGSHRNNGMPGFGIGAGFPLAGTKMSVEDANAIHAYIIDLSWKAYNADQARLRSANGHP